MSSKQTIYLAYGSNLWLHQMSLRCPSSRPLGIARLPHHTFLINTRGYANIVATPSSSSPSNASSDATSFKNKVYGIVYALTPADEAALDKNEGVPVAYTKERVACDFWPLDMQGETRGKADLEMAPAPLQDVLVYVDKLRVEPDRPREEYIVRMNKGIRDALRLGMPEGYVRDVMREFIPEEDGDGDGEGGEEVGEFARAQAARFRDESGVIQ